MNKKRIHQILSRNSVTKFFYIPLVALAFTVVSCNESTVVGLDVQPASDLLNVGFQDTTTLITKTVREDSLHTDASVIITADALIGSYWDPTFGLTTASFYTQLHLPTNNPTFGTNPIVDSVVLALTYDPGFYGKTDHKPQYVNVYQLSDDISLSDDYYSNDAVNRYPFDLSSNHIFTPHPSTKVVVWGDTLKPQLRIPIDNNFGQAILNNQGVGTLASNTTFQNFCKGLYITTENTSWDNALEGNILHFKMADSQTKMSIYYHNSNATNNDSLKYELTLGSVARFSTFKHNYTSATMPVDPYLVQQLGSSPPATDSILFIQAMSGTKVKIEMPYLMHWNDSGAVAINKAELVIKVDTRQSWYKLDTFAAPTKLVLFGVNADGTNYVMPDVYETNQPIDGTYNTSNKEYHFNIDRYIQQVLTGRRENTGLFLSVSGGAVNANRVVVGGGSALGSTKMKLKLTYTKLH